MRKQYVVFGAGKFGGSVARNLQHMGCDVIAVDSDAEVIQRLADDVSYAICANVNDPDTFEHLRLKNVDGAVIAITTSLETSIILAMKCKEIGIPYILAKAKNELHEKILMKVGATRVIYPEEEMGRRAARQIMADKFLEWIDLSKTCSLVEMEIPEEWKGKTLVELHVRENIISM